MDSGARKVSPDDQVFRHHARELQRMRADARATKQQAHMTQAHMTQEERWRQLDAHELQAKYNASLRNLAAVREEIAVFFEMYACDESLDLFEAYDSSVDEDGNCSSWELWLETLPAVQEQHKEQLVMELRAHGWDATYHSHYPSEKTNWIRLSVLESESES